jgi:hypothetical protein
MSCLDRLLVYPCRCLLTITATYIELTNAFSANRCQCGSVSLTRRGFFRETGESSISRTRHDDAE